MVYRDNAIFNRGNQLLKSHKGRNPPAAEQAGEDGGEGAVDVAGLCNDGGLESTNHWYILTAGAISKVSSQLQYELLGGKIIPYFVEWCRTDMPRVKGVCFQDCAYRYDHLGETVSFYKDCMYNT